MRLMYSQSEGTAHMWSLFSSYSFQIKLQLKKKQLFSASGNKHTLYNKSSFFFYLWPAHSLRNKPFTFTQEYNALYPTQLEPQVAKQQMPLLELTIAD